MALKLKLYAMKDNIVGSYKSIAQFNNDAEAIRALKMAGRSINDLTTAHKDNDLYYLGEYNTDTGEIIPCTPEFVIHMTDCVHPSIMAALDRPLEKPIINNFNEEEPKNGGEN